MPRGGEIKSLHGPYGLLRRLDPDRMDDKLLDIANETAAIIEGKIIERIQPISGDLAASVEVKVDPGLDGRYRIIATAEAFNERGDDYAPYVERGTGIFGPKHHMIKAENPRGMGFFWKQKGKYRDYPGFRFGKWRGVKEHHGAKAQWFMKRGWRNGMAIARRRWRSILKID